MEIMHEMVSVNELRPGMVVAQDTYSWQGKLLAPAGTVLSRFAIAHLLACECMEVWVDKSQTTFLH